MEKEKDNKKQSFYAKKVELIKLIEWYRDEWHKHDQGHSEAIEFVRKAKHQDDLDQIRNLFDGWLNK